jgi:tetratricopeptide (TPR) repeat protein
MGAMMKTDAATLKCLEATATTAPKAAISGATQCLADGCSPSTQVKLMWIRAIAYIKERKIGLALSDLNAACRLANSSGNRRLLAQVLVTKAGTESYNDPVAALATLAEVPNGVGAKLAADVEVQRALLLQRATRPVEAEEALSAALALMTRASAKDRADLRANRGVLRTYQGRFVQAEADFVAALKTYERLGLAVQIAELIHNIAWLDGRRGHLVESLRGFEEAADRYPDDIPEEQRYPDECETYLALGLTAAAHARALKSARWLEQCDDHADAAEVFLIAARAALAGGDFDSAAVAAGDAERLLRGTDRPGWHAEASLLMLEGRIRRDGSSEDEIRELAGLFDRLDRSGLHSSATDALLLLSRAALEHGDLDIAERSLRRCARRHPTAQQQASMLAVRARSASARGAAGSAQRAIAAGARLLETTRRRLGAPELRAHLALHGVELADLDIELALGDGRPASLLRSSERWRAAAMCYPRLRPPDEETLSSKLDELRGLEELAQRHAAKGERDVGLERRLRMVQRDVLRRSRAVGEAGDRPIESISIRRVAPLLAGQDLLVIVEHRGHLYGMTPLAHRSGISSLGSSLDVQLEAVHLRSALNHLLAAPADRSARYEAHVAASASRLGDVLLQPLPPGERPVVLVLPASLAGVPWACLPGLRERPYTISPSLAVWAHLAGLDDSPDGPVVLAAGPGLRHADREVRALTRLHDHPQVFGSRAATPSALLEVLEGTRLAHFACHGMINAANPLLSQLKMTGGPLYVYDLEQLTAPPRLCVVSACHVGFGASRPGDELLGFTSSLLSLGGRSVIAAVQAVPDSTVTASLMVELHRRLIAGDSPARALASVRQRAGGVPNPALAFSCFGVS